MKSRSLGYLAAALGIVLTAVGLWLAKTFPEAAGAMAAHVVCLHKHSFRPSAGKAAARCFWQMWGAKPT